MSLKNTVLELRKWIVFEVLFFLCWVLYRIGSNDSTRLMGIPSQKLEKMAGVAHIRSPFISGYFRAVVSLKKQRDSVAEQEGGV